jgi:hypothetical protein
LDLATSGKGGLGTFIGVCTISGIFGIADAYTQGGMIGDLSYMLPEFMQVSITIIYRAWAQKPKTTRTLT